MREIDNGCQLPIPFLMTQSVDHLTGATGVGPTVTISKNGSTFAAPQGIGSGTITEMGDGWYAFNPGLNDVSTNGVLVIHATASSCDPTDQSIVVSDTMTKLTRRMYAVLLEQFGAGSQASLAEFMSTIDGI